MFARQELYKQPSPDTLFHSDWLVIPTRSWGFPLQPPAFVSQHQSGHCRAARHPASSLLGQLDIPPPASWGGSPSQLQPPGAEFDIPPPASGAAHHPSSSLPGQLDIPAPASGAAHHPARPGRLSEDGAKRREKR